MQPLECQNRVDDLGRPAGGFVEGVGLSIQWQDGPLMVDGSRRPPNGAFVETVLQAARQRLEHYQGCPFACAENAEALEHVDAALRALQRRTARREAKGVEGTHVTDPAAERGAGAVPAADGAWPCEAPPAALPATHRCKVCGALWRLNPALAPEATGMPATYPLHFETWSLVSASCGKCCDNVAMGEQIEALGGPDEVPARPEDRT